MAVKISSVMHQRAVMKMKVGEDSLTITYNPAALTPEIESELRTDPNSPFVSAMYARMLAEVIIEWDMVEDDGSPVEVSEDRFRSIPSRFLSDCVEAVAEDMNPSAKKAGKQSRSSGSFS